MPALWHVRYSSLPRLVQGVHRRLSASQGVRRIVCVSAAAAAVFPHCPDKVKVIHNGLDVERLRRCEGARERCARELGLGPQVVVFGSHGRVLRRKGYVEMVRGAKLALERLGATERARLAFVVVGDTPGDFVVDHVEECRALAAQLGIADRVHLLGFRADVRPLVADFDVAVVPSVYADPLPRSVIESMALGKPVDRLRRRRRDRDARRRLGGGARPLRARPGERGGREHGVGRAPRRRLRALRARPRTSAYDRDGLHAGASSATSMPASTLDASRTRSSSLRGWPPSADEADGRIDRRRERPPPAPRALRHARRARRYLVLRAAGPRRTHTPTCASSCRSTARASRPSSTSSVASGAVRRSSSSPSRPDRKQNERFLDDLAGRLNGDGRGAEEGRAPAHRVRRERLEGRAPLLRGQQVALRRRADLEDAYDTIDRQIAIRSGMVEDLGDDESPPAPAPPPASAAPAPRQPAAAPPTKAQPALGLDQLPRSLEGQGQGARRFPVRATSRRTTGR